jgi:flavin-dependent dehydrogenase
MREAASVAVGGGLAGSAFAIELARHGRRVTVLEKTAGQHHKVCGEFLSGEAQEHLAQLGIDVWASGAAPLTELSLEFGNYRAKFPLPFRGAGLSRFCLDQLLLDAAARGGAEIIRGATVTRLDYDRDGVVIHTARERLEAAHVALASGKHNLRGLARPQASTVAFKMQLQPGRAAAQILDRLVHLSMFNGGYAGVCLVENGIATVCWVTESDRLEGDESAGWHVHARFLSQRSAFFAALLGDATPLWDKAVAVAAIPYGYIRETVIADAVYPVGDQFVVIPSYTGDGTSLALHTGLSAARAVLQNRPAGDFQAAMVRKLKPQIAWAKLANFAFVNAPAQRLTVAIARISPWLLPRVATFITRKTRLRS